MKFILNIVLSFLVVISLSLFLFIRFDNGYSTSNWSKVDGCLQSLIASLLFLILVFLLVKPSLKISDIIAEIPDDNGKVGSYKIKIVNHSIFRAFDLVIYLYKVERTTETGPDLSITLLGKIEGAESTIPYLESGIRGSFNEAKPHAAQMRLNRISKDYLVKEVLDDKHSYLMIYVKLKHGLSGLQGNFIKKYHNADCIKPGRFRHGFFTEIK